MTSGNKMTHMQGMQQIIENKNNIKNAYPAIFLAEISKSRV